MSKAINSLYNLRVLDEMALKPTVIHRIHPLIKLLTTFIYLVMVISFDKYEIGAMIPYVFYLVIVLALAELPLWPILQRLLLVSPLIIGIGILNPFFDTQTILLGSVTISRGWVTFLSLLIKSGLTITASLMLIATTGMDQLAVALRMLKVPKIFVLQLLLTYRYISVLIEEVSRMQRAYAMRAPNQKGIQRKVWGSFAGQLLLRTLDRGQRVYLSMNLRGFEGEYHTKQVAPVTWWDLLYLMGWLLFFTYARVNNLTILLGSIFTGVIK